MRFLADSTHGVDLIGPASGATGTERFKLRLLTVAAGGGAPILELDTGGTITRDVTDPVLWGSDLGVTVQPYSPYGDTSTVMNSDQSSTSTTIAGITELGIAVGSGFQGSFRAAIIFQTAATTTGIRLGLVAPTMSYIAWNASIPTSISAFDFGAFHATTQVLQTAGIDAANTSYLAILEGNFKTSASGTFRIGLATEVGGSSVTVKTGSSLTITSIPDL
jgi:hypothetical protein